jgi:hypothetical protein
MDRTPKPPTSLKNPQVLRGIDSLAELVNRTVDRLLPKGRQQKSA